MLPSAPYHGLTIRYQMSRCENESLHNSALPVSFSSESHNSSVRRGIEPAAQSFSYLHTGRA